MDFVSETGETPLHRAASRGHLRAVATLLQQGACVDRLSSEHKTALHYATKRAHLKVLCLLLAHGVDRELVKGDSEVYQIVNNLQVHLS